MPIASFRAKFDRSLDDADLAMEFVECEVGHYDWTNNWPKFKSRYPTHEALVARVKTWLDAMEIEHDPSQIVNYLDRMLEDRPGKWR